MRIPMSGIRQSVLLLSLVYLAACGRNATTGTTDAVNDTTRRDTAAPAQDLNADRLSYFGDTITAEGAQPMSIVPVMLANKATGEAKLQGKIAGVCQAAGCWVDLAMPGEEKLRVRFGHEFFVPKTVQGKQAVVKGYITYDTLSVADRRHFAEDEGKSPKEIAAITEPEITPIFEASGIAVEN